MNERKWYRFWTPEFILVVFMLIVLVALVCVVMLVELDIPKTDEVTNFSDILDYRKNILSIIITAFGAWVGAGAAYFFGRENLREAANSILAMREISPAERLKKTPIKEVPPRPMVWLVKITDAIETVIHTLQDKPDYWFVPIVDEDNVLLHIISEEAVWRFIHTLSEKEKKYADIKKQTVKDLIKFIGDTEDLDKFIDDKVYVQVTLDMNVYDANYKMENKNVRLAVVLDEDKKAKQFITTSDIRHLLMAV